MCSRQCIWPLLQRLLGPFLFHLPEINKASAEWPWLESDAGHERLVAHRRQLGWVQNCEHLFSVSSAIIFITRVGAVCEVWHIAAFLHHLQCLLYEKQIFHSDLNIPKQYLQSVSAEDPEVRLCNYSLCPSKRSTFFFTVLIFMCRCLSPPGTELGLIEQEHMTMTMLLSCAIALRFSSAHCFLCNNTSTRNEIE